MFYYYFAKYILTSPARQRLLLLSLLGLFLSSFALMIVLTMIDGLQGNIVQRSQDIEGSLVIYETLTEERIKRLQSILQEQNISYYLEYELEVLLRNKESVLLATLHGVDKRLSFLKDGHLALSYQLARALGARESSLIDIVVLGENYPTLLGNIPRITQDRVSALFVTHVTELDLNHAYISLSSVQNLIRRREVNRVRILSPLPSALLNELKKDYQVRSWEELHAELHWSLLLERRVLTILFTLTALLISISIICGMIIFMDRAKRDWISFWILGMSKKRVERMLIIFMQLLSSLTIIAGIVVAIGFLQLIKSSHIALLPSIFLDRQIPINWRVNNILLATIIPLLMVNIFLLPTLYSIARKRNYIEIIKRING